ncbi:MAG: UDP-N-acetylmuramate dehydrogenase [Abditibacteriaceae bacterium]
MQIQKRVSLKNLNTFGIAAVADSLVELTTLSDAVSYFQNEHDVSAKSFVLGGGSNVLFLDDFHGRVIQNQLKGIAEINADAEHVYVEVAAGENWHQFVLHCICNDWAGVENLSLIPGNVGASPMQNIGAYGVEVKDVIQEVKAIEMASGKTRSFGAPECEFGYRSSVFKTSLKDKFFITSVVFRLNKHPEFNTSYGAIAAELATFDDPRPSLRNISQAVINIRESKLPNPKVVGNAGSFFKNPIITKAQCESLKVQFPAIPVYPVSDESVKVPAGWLIEQCGWKGKNFGGYGVHKNHSLVLVNHGGASGRKIFELSENIIDSVREKFHVRLEREVNVVS